MTGVFASGAPVEECADYVPNMSNNCTFWAGGFCAYHSYFPNFRGIDLPYVYLSDANFNANDCKNGIISPVPGHTIAEDQEIALMSREFADSVTDPDATAWNTPKEIGKLCDGLAYPVYTVFFGGSPFIVQQLWSNASSTCVSSLPTILNLFPNWDPITAENHQQAETHQ